MRNNLVFVFCILYVIIYIITKVWSRPNLEAFNQGEKIIRIRDVIGAKGLVEITFRKPALAEGENINKYEVVLKKGLGIIGIKTLSQDLNKELIKYTINDPKIVDNTDYSIYVIGRTNTNKMIESIPYSFRTNDRNKNIIELNQDILMDMDKNRKVFLTQETEQNTQNRVIKDLKKRVDLLRSDMVVLKNKDKNELRSMQNVIQSGDSVSQVLGMPGMINGVGNASDMLSGNYNVNFNLE